MNSERWRQVSNVLDEVLERPAGERQILLERLCGSDSALRADVERLLHADERSEGFLDAPIEQVQQLLDAPEFSDSERLDWPPGTEVGPYRIVREIGRGGMGVVCLAERADGAFDQHVALKIVHAESTSEASRQRFLQERQILADLDHPGIARLLDGGVTQDGRPYFAMEYVEGEPITTYCDRHGLGLEDRVRQFLDVCRAVEAAHRHLIVHRDLKPSNIVVAAGGRVKLLDFGIAKTLDERSAGSLTRLGGHPMTPEYAAPEQIRQARVTVMTDVYGLGLVLYEVLTGQRPYRVETALEMPSAILRQEPGRPSVVASAPWRKRLAGDLDTILLTALRKEPERRYQSAEALRADLERYLARRPILARSDSFVYRATRFVQRHAVGVAAAAVVILSVVAGIVGVVWQSRLASQQARRAEAAKTFMAGVFRLSDPSEAVGQTLQAREILDLAARRIDTELAGSPEIQADMLTLIGRIFTQLGLYRNASPALNRGLELRRQIHGSQHRDVADSLDALGALYTRQGQYGEAEKTLRSALDLIGNTVGAESAEAAATLQHLADVQIQRASFAAAEASAQQALAIRSRLSGPRDPSVAESLVLIANARRGRGDLDRATALDQEAFDIRRAHFGEDHPDVINSLAGLALDRFDHGQYNEAEELYRRALAAARRTLGPDHPDTLQILSDLASTIAQQGRLVAGEVLLREALDARRLRVGASHPSLIPNLNALASTLRRLDRREEAEQLYLDALKIAETQLGPDHLEVAKGLNDLGTLYRERGKLAEAEAMLRRAIPILRTSVGDEHLYVGRTTAELAHVQLDRGEVSDAEVGYRRALVIMRAALPPGHDLIGDVTLGLGRTLMLQHAAVEAESLLREAVIIFRATYGDGDTRTAEAAFALGECLVSNGLASDASAILAQSYDALRAARGERDPLTRRAVDARRRAAAAERHVTRAPITVRTR
jgi:serine/threonine-protein kinase